MEHITGTHLVNVAIRQGNVIAPRQLEPQFGLKRSLDVKVKFGLR
jgi:hypothetical protein